LRDSCQFASVDFANNAARYAKAPRRYSSFKNFQNSAKIALHLHTRVMIGGGFD
jgi:hypothetical protein